MRSGSPAIITLTTDFGEDSPYVAAMKGVILGINPHAQIVDLTHQIPAQDIQHAAFFLATAIPYFPEAAIHIVVVDPGVGTTRNLLYVEVENHQLLAPDNGAWALLARGRSVRQVRRLTEPRYWRPTVSATFHGRDILAPVAAHLSLGTDPTLLGPPVDRWVELSLPAPRRDEHALVGEVIFIDGFGNLITNIPDSDLPTQGPYNVTIEGTAIDRWVKAYGDAQPGDLVALIGSSGLLEIAVVQDNAAVRLKVDRGARVVVPLHGQQRRGVT